MNEKQKLIGIDAISDFAEAEIITLLNWQRDFDFPMKKTLLGGIWQADAEAIKNWFKTRNLNPKTVTCEKLLKYKQLTAFISGKYQKFNKRLHGADAIAKFMDANFSSIIDWMNNWTGCPIKRGKDGQITVDADELLQWHAGIEFKTGIFLR